MESLWMNSWKLKWDLIDPYIQKFPNPGSLLVLLTTHCTSELVNWNMTIYKVFKIFLIIPWCCKLLEFDFRILFASKIISQL